MKAQQDASETLGMASGQSLAESLGDRVVINGTRWGPDAGPDLAGKPQASGAGTFDMVAISSDGKYFDVIECKGGASRLSSDGRVIGQDAAGNDIRAAQGSTAYFEDLLTQDPNLKAYFEAHPDIAQALREEHITPRYWLAKAPGDGTASATQLLLDPSALNLAKLGTP